MENLESPLDTKELEPKVNHIILDGIRHGETEYVEEFGAAENGPVRDLTPKGEEQIRQVAEEIVSKIDPDKEIVVLWSSPKWRAQGSEEIVKEILAEKGITVFKDSDISSLTAFKKHDQAFMANLWKDYGALGKPFDAIYAKDPAFQTVNDKFETQGEVKHRTERFFYRVAQLAKTANLNGKTLHIISVSHFEVLNPIVEDLFGHDVEQGQGIAKGEDLHFDFKYQTETDQLDIESDFRGEHKIGIKLNEQDRKFETEADV
ncbi:MAG: histidine phosphatase family protein [Patescibacteria group bacterium]